VRPRALDVFAAVHAGEELSPLGLGGSPRSAPRRLPYLSAGGHAQDLDDLQEMLDRGLVEKERLRACFSEIEPQLYRFPAIDAADFRKGVEELLGS
jgi:hypothetical protein